MSLVAAIQMNSSNSVDENLIVADKLIKEAADQGAKLAVLPEMFAVMGVDAMDKVNVKESEKGGIIQTFLASAAFKNKLWIVGGTIPIAAHTDPNKVRAATLVFDDQGKQIARYDKIHLFDVNVSAEEVYKESHTTEPGNQLILINTPFGRIGLGVCYDVRFPEMFRYLFNQGAEIFVLPAAFTKKTGSAHWELLARTRAVENVCYVVGACQTGLHNNKRETYGHSLIVNPWGEIIAALPEGVGVIFADINLELLHQIRNSIPVASHQKIFMNLGDDISFNSV